MAAFIRSSVSRSNLCPQNRVHRAFLGPAFRFVDLILKVSNFDHQLKTREGLLTSYLLASGISFDDHQRENPVQCELPPDIAWFSNSVDMRPPRQVVRPHINHDSGEAQHDADPEHRRMMNLPPVASFISVCISILIFAVHRSVRLCRRQLMSRDSILLS